MKKHFRKIPDFIQRRIQEFDSNFIVATVINLVEDDFNNHIYSDLGIRIKNRQVVYNEEFVPNRLKGIFSRKNIEGYKIKHKDRPKVLKSYYAGERPIFGNYSNGTFSLYISRMIFPYDDIPPREISFVVELLQTRVEDGINHYIFKISTKRILNTTIPDFTDELFFNLNLLQENIGSVNVFEIDTPLDDFLNTLRVEWEIFPPGESDADLNRITRNLRNISPVRLQEITERYNFLRSKNPIDLIYGRSGILGYFGARFSDNLVVFENTNYGNALYILFENWEELSRLSRLEIQNRPRDQYIRIEHRGDWQKTVGGIIKGRLSGIR